MGKPVVCIYTLIILCTILILETFSLRSVTLGFNTYPHFFKKFVFKFCTTDNCTYYDADRKINERVVPVLTDLNVTCASHERVEMFRFPICEWNKIETQYSSVGNISNTVNLDAGLNNQFVFKSNKACPGFYFCRIAGETHVYTLADDSTIQYNLTARDIYGDVDIHLLTNVTETCGDGSSSPKNNSVLAVDNVEVNSVFKPSLRGDDRPIYLRKRTGGALRNHICRIQNMEYNNTSWFSLFSRWITTIFHVHIEPMKVRHTEIGDIIAEHTQESHIGIGDTVVLNCYTAIGTTNESNISMYWTYPNGILEPHSVIQGELIRRIHDIDDYDYAEYYDYTDAMNITLVNLTKSFEGNYTCHVKVLTYEKHVPFNLIVHSPFPPTLNKESTNMNDDITTIGSGESFALKCIVDGYPAPQITWLKDGALIPLLSNDTQETLNITKFSPSDEGKYTCIADNKYGNTSVSETVKIKNGFGYLIWFLIIILIISVCCIAILVCVVGRNRKERRALREELEKIITVNFEESTNGELNPEIGIENQTDLIPYDRRWEFPREKLLIGEQLGSGAFGMVKKGEANDIIDEGRTTTVAVKMVKVGTNPMHLQALVSELKIMIYLGRHLNIVNLLGACTGDLRKRDLMVIVEYCGHGNLHDLLLDQRGQFINQINNKGRLDFSITDGYYTFQGGTLKYPRMVLHGDLAARNVLLADGNIVKICDFGLAKSMYKNDIYQRKRHELLPVRWMALESIRDRVFSVHSDVWSFGVTMWELFSLSVMPYPGIEDLGTLYTKLSEGYRLEQPLYASKEIYGIMIDCWHAEPTQRSTFLDLNARLKALLGEQLTSYYENMNSEYLRLNKNENSYTDYLKLLNLPPNVASEEPRYQNLPMENSSNKKEAECLRLSENENSCTDYLKLLNLPPNASTEEPQCRHLPTESSSNKREGDLKEET